MVTEGMNQGVPPKRQPGGSVAMRCSNLAGVQDIRNDRLNTLRARPSSITRQLGPFTIHRSRPAIPLVIRRGSCCGK